MTIYDEIIKKQLSDGIIEEADCTKEYLQRDNNTLPTTSFEAIK